MIRLYINLVLFKLSRLELKCIEDFCEGICECREINKKGFQYGGEISVHGLLFLQLRIKGVLIPEQQAMMPGLHFAVHPGFPLTPHQSLKILICETINRINKI